MHHHVFVYYKDLLITLSKNGTTSRQEKDEIRKKRLLFKVQYHFSFTKGSSFSQRVLFENYVQKFCEKMRLLNKKGESQPKEQKSSIITASHKQRPWPRRLLKRRRRRLLMSEAGTEQIEKDKQSIQNAQRNKIGEEVKRVVHSGNDEWLEQKFLSDYSKPSMFIGEIRQLCDGSQLKQMPS